MKKLVSVVMLSLCCMMAGCSGNKKGIIKETNQQQKEVQWKTLTKIQHTQNIYSTGFYSKSFGVAAGYSGLIEYTNDGGKTWKKADNTSLCRFGAEIISEKVAYTCGNGGNVTRTVDGAKTWNQVADFGDSEPDQCTILSFVSEKVGMIASAKRMAFTKDGGNHWTELTPPAEIITLQLVNEKTCYLVGKDKMLYKSMDGGQNWEKQPLTLPDMSDYKTNLKSMALYMDESGNGELFCMDETGTLKAYKTESKEGNWVNEEIPEITGQSFLYMSKDGTLLTSYDSTGKSVVVLSKK